MGLAPISSLGPTQIDAQVDVTDAHLVATKIGLRAPRKRLLVSDPNRKPTGPRSGPASCWPTPSARAATDWGTQS
jgi:hypothetical protein